MRWTMRLLAAGGLLLAVWLVVDHGTADVLAATEVVGWGLAAVLAFRAVPVMCDALGWWVLFQPGSRPRLVPTGWVRWISESVNALLPVAQIGGEVVRARLIGRCGGVAIPSGEAAATVIVDMTTGLIASALFSLLGVALLLALHTEVDLGIGLWWALGGTLPILAGFVVAQRSGLVTRAIRGMATTLARGKAGAFVAQVETLERCFERLWREPGALAASTAWRLASFLAGAGEVWLVLHLLGAPVSWGDAVMLEALSTAARSAAFAIPGGLGIQEGSLLLLGQVVGLDGETALALALVKRLREVLTGLPALALWWWIGGRRTGAAAGGL